MKKKIKLEDLKVQGFSTSNHLSENETQQLIGGTHPTDLNSHCCPPGDTDHYSCDPNHSPGNPPPNPTAGCPPTAHCTSPQGCGGGDTSPMYCG